MQVIAKLLENGNQLDMGKHANYAGILGESPSRGARSPTLWNTVFLDQGIDARMYPLDVTRDNLHSLVCELRRDERFIGGAVALPYKSKVMESLDAVENDAKIIGAVNCIYRDNDMLIGCNTDGSGALKSLIDNLCMEGIKGKNVALIGPGGAGRAVSSSIAQELRETGTLTICSRNLPAAKNFETKLQHMFDVKTASVSVDSRFLVGIDILINCTPVGFSETRIDSKGAYCLRSFSPLGPTGNVRLAINGENSQELYFRAAFSDIKKNWLASLEVLETFSGVVFDIIYQPEQTMLMCMAEAAGLQVLGGKPMNLEQAVIAFKKVVDGFFDLNVSDERIRSTMAIA